MSRVPLTERVIPIEDRLIRHESDIAISRNRDQYATGATTEVVNLTKADTEYSCTIPDRCRRVEVFARNGAEIRWSFTAGNVASAVSTASSAHWVQVTTPYVMDNVKLTGKTLYLASSTAATPVQITAWV